MAIDIKNTLKVTQPRIRYEDIALEILGSNYELSLVVCGDGLAQKMNKKYRSKTYKPNVLSFPISKGDGEIFLNVACAKREAKKFKVALRDRLALLFVHGCFHLKGLDHGDRMEREEKRILKMFGFSV